MRNARRASFSAWMRPVKETVSPTSRLTTVTVRTGRTCGAAVSASGWQAAEQNRRQSGEQEAQARVRIAEQAAHDREGDAPASARGPTIQAWTTHAGKHAPHVALRGHASVVRTEINAESARASSAPPA